MRSLLLTTLVAATLSSPGCFRLLGPSGGNGPGGGDADADADSESCVPDCSGRECGPDPVCGEPCGLAPCPTGMYCDADGLCVTSSAGTWVRIHAGTFVMGSPPGELGRHPGGPFGSRETQHQVTLSRDFEILSTEVTQAEFEALLGHDPSWFDFAGGALPVESLTWHEAAAYCNALSDGATLEPCFDCTGAGRSVVCAPAAAYSSPYDCPGYRLPTEAEWEYASRAGTTTATYEGDLDVDDCTSSAVLEPIAWFCGNSGDETHPVASLRPNRWGLFDMLGNVYELCLDVSEDDLGSAPVTDPFGPPSGSSRVARGGSFHYQAFASRAALRGAADPADDDWGIGFRPVRSLP